MAIIKNWKRTNKDLGNNKLVYSNVQTNVWLGVGKNKDSSWTVITPTGVQRAPFPNKAEALKYATAYMRLNPMDKSKKTIKVVYYRWGEFKEVQEMELKTLKEMEQLSSDDLLGFTIRPQDQDKCFYADPSDIERPEDEYDDTGTGVKMAYATSKEVEQ